MFRIYGSLAEGGSEARPTGVAVGNFDGVHTGHRRLFRRAVTVSQENGWRPSVLTFEPHPTQVVAPDRAPKLLNTAEQRCELMREEGIEQVFVIRFDTTFARQSPRDFVQHVLIEGVGAAGVFVGENFRFGARQAGDVNLLSRLGQELGLLVEVVPSVYVRGRMASSTEVRRLLESGNVSLAGRLLERPYWVEGEIVSGHGIGAKQTVPTLNLHSNAEVLPADGVYITRTIDSDDGRSWNSITNIGMRPTFDGDRRTIETFLLSAFDGRTPGRIRLSFCKRVREERKFQSPEDLKRQIFRDVQVAMKFFHRTSVLKFA